MLAFLRAATPNFMINLFFFHSFIFVLDLLCAFLSSFASFASQLICSRFHDFYFIFCFHSLSLVLDLLCAFLSSFDAFVSQLMCSRCHDFLFFFGFHSFSSLLHLLCTYSQLVCLFYFGNYCALDFMNFFYLFPQFQLPSRSSLCLQTARLPLLF